MSRATKALIEAVEDLQAGQEDERVVGECKDGLVELRLLLSRLAEEAKEMEVELEEADVAYSATWRRLQAVELKRKFVLEEIGELESEEQQMREAWVTEGVFGDVSLLDVEGSDFDTELDKRANGELRGREDLQARLRELQARKQALLAKKSQEVKGIHHLESEMDALLKSMEGVRLDIRETDTPARISCALGMLSLPLRLLYNQMSACKRALGLNIDLIIRDKRRGEAALPSNPYGWKGDMAVVLRIFEEGSKKIVTAMEFKEKGGLVYVSSPAYQALLSSLFKGDSGLRMPSAVVPGLAPGRVTRPLEGRDKPSLPFKWAQLLGGVDFLPRHDEAHDDPAVMARVDKGIKLYRAEGRVPRFLERIRQHALALGEFKYGMAALEWEGATKQCSDPHTRAKVKEFSLVKISRKSNEPSAKRRRGEDGSSLPVATKEKVPGVGKRYTIYKAVLDCEGMELSGKVCFPMTNPGRPLFFIDTISTANCSRQVEPRSINSARKWMGAQLSSTDCDDANPLAHLTRMVETFGAWVSTLMGPVRPPPVPMGRDRAVRVPTLERTKRKRDS